MGAIENPKKRVGWGWLLAVLPLIYVVNNWFILHGTAYGTLPSEHGMAIKVQGEEAFRPVSKEIWFYSFVSDAVANLAMAACFLLYGVFLLRQKGKAWAWVFIPLGVYCVFGSGRSVFRTLMDWVQWDSSVVALGVRGIHEK